MPNTRNIDGRTVTAGRFRGDDEVATKVIVQQIGQAGGGQGVHMDPSNLEGPIVVKYNLNTGQKGLTVEEANSGQDVFSIGEFGTTKIHRDLETDGDSVTLDCADEFNVLDGNGVKVIEGLFATGVPTLELRAATTIHDTVTLKENTYCADTFICEHLGALQSVSGDAFDKVDDHTALKLADTAVTRDSANGVVNITNLRVFGRTMPNQVYNEVVGDYITNGTCPDGFEPGLFFTQGALSGTLRLVDDGNVVFEHSAGQPAARSYRFGVSEGATDPASDGLLFVKGDDEGAIARYREAIDLAPTLAIAWNGLSMALARKGQLEEAVAAAEKLVELEPEDPLSHTNLSRILMQKGMIPEAEDARAKAMGLQMKQGG